MKKFFLFLLFNCIFFSSYSQYQWIWGILRRGSINYIKNYAVDELLLKNSGLNWYTKQGIKYLLDEALTETGYPVVNNPANCLFVEFDGQTNRIGNYCNYPVKISAIAQYVNTLGRVIISTCEECYVEPMQSISFATPDGPFVAVYYENSQNSYNNYQTPQSNNGNGIWTRLLSWSKNRDEATIIFELNNSTNTAIGLKVATHSIWSIANARIYNKCGGVYEQANSVYDKFSGISKDNSTPTWIAPGNKIIISFQTNTLTGNDCDLSYAVVDVFTFQPGSGYGQSMPIIVYIDQ